MTRRKSKPICVYCDKQEGTTKDHVPPKNLFPPPRPELITVPCCEICRRGQTLDDEYFVRTIVMRADVGRDPNAQFALAAVHRSLTRPQKAGFTRALINSMSELPIFTPGGLYVGHATTYDADFNRLCRVIKRVTQGLYYHEYRVRLPDSCKCIAYALDGFASARADAKAKVNRVIQVALSGEKRNLGDNVFTYWFQRLPDSQFATVWMFLVYGRVQFMAYTTLSEDKRDAIGG